MPDTMTVTKKAVWTQEDRSKARSEGWDVFLDFNAGSIKNIRPKVPGSVDVDIGDAMAEDFVHIPMMRLVAEQAANGSALHIKALCCISITELQRFFIFCSPKAVNVVKHIFEERVVAETLSPWFTEEMEWRNFSPESVLGPAEV